MITTSTPIDITAPIQNGFLSFIEGHPLLWFAILIIVVLYLILERLGSIIPHVEIVRSKVLIPLAKQFRHKGLIKAATASDVVGHVNRELQKMRTELPTGWIREMKIDWVTTESKEDLLNENEIVIRIRPLENQDMNFAKAAYYFLKKSFFPRTKQVIPQAHREASVLYICRKMVRARGQNAETVFEDNILEPAIQKNKQIPQHLEDYGHLDGRGFFTGTFLREMQEMANEVRFTTQRGNVGSEAAAVLKHIKEFISAYESEGGRIPSKYWSQIGPVSSYGLLLVAHPVKATFSNGVTPYVNRAKEKVLEGVKRLYVFGTNQESDFVGRVIEGIQSSVPELVLSEKFSTRLDYRGNENGTGAIFIRK